MKFELKIIGRGLGLGLLLLVLWVGIVSAALVDNGDGTVSDTETGLMWQQAEAGSMNWQDALDSCEDLVLPTGGYNDWRLPDRNELESLVDCSRYNPCLDKTFFPGVLSSDYWSSTTHAYYTSHAWLVHFYNGYVHYGSPKSSSRYVRAVRSGQSGSFGHLTISRDSINFSDVQVNTSSIPESLIISSQGEATLVLGTLSISGADSGSFGISDNPCSQALLAPGESCTVAVVFSPASTGLKEAVLAIPSNDPSGTVQVALSGTGWEATVIDDVTNGIEGYVYGDGEPLFKATVFLGGASVLTDISGYYCIGGNFSGSYPFSVAKDGFYAYAEEVYIGSSTKVKEVILVVEEAGPLPVITDYFCDYEGIFLEGVTVNNEYGVRVDWQGDPGLVEFNLNGTQHFEVGSVFGAYHTFDMGSDFRGNASLFGNTLEIVAVNAQGERSEPVTFHPVVIPIPVWCQFPGLSLLAATKSGESTVSFEVGYDFPAEPFSGKCSIPDYVPFIGGYDLGLKETQAGLHLDFKSTGTCGLTVAGATGFTAGGQNLQGQVTGSGDFEYVPGSGLELMRLSLGISVGGELEFVRPVIELIPGLSGITSIPGMPRFIKKVKAGMVIGPNLGLLLNLIDDNGLKFESTEFGALITLKLFLKVEIIRDIRAEMYGGGVVDVIFQFPADPDLLKSFMVGLYVGLKIKALHFYEEFNKGWTYPPIGESAMVKSLSFPESLEEISLKPILPDFIKYGEPLRSGRSSREGVRLADGDNPQIYNILENVYRYSEPEMAESGGTSVITFVYYDTNDELLRNTEIYYCVFDGTSFTVPAPILDDTRADFNQQIAFDGNGKAVAVWERVKDEFFPSDGEFSEMAAELELVYAVYDPVAGSWSVPVELTDNNYLDHNPLLKRNPDGELLLLWESNQNNKFESTTADPSQINYRIWNGTQWSFAATAMANVAGACQFDAAFWPEGAILVWTQDMDDDFSTDSDQEIYYSLFTGTPPVWSGPLRLTNNAVSDSNPRVEGNAAGSFHLLWHSDNGIVQLTDLDNGLYQPVRTDDIMGVGAIDFRIALDNNSNLALIWQGQNIEGADIYYRIFDDLNNCWSRDRQLTSGDAMEKFNQPIFSSDNTLMIAYNNALTEYVTKEVEIDGQMVTIENVPEQGRNDLNLLTYKPTEDLGFVDGALTFTEAPAPGVATAINATVTNLGDMAMPEVKVAFYDGDPAAGGVQIGLEQTVIGGLDAGDSDQLSVAWNVPDDGQAHTVYAKVDPDSLIIESDEDNNTISVTTLLPDVVYVSGEARVLGNDQLSLVVTVSNQGTVVANNVVVDFYLDWLTGEFLGSGTITALAAGATAEVLLPWASDGIGLLLGNDIIVISLDQAAQIIEGDESNNQGTITTLLNRSADTSKAYVCKPGTSNKLPQYQTVEEAVTALVSPGTVMIQSDSFLGNVEVNASGVVVLEGGYTNDFTALDGESVISGCLTINSGSLEVDRLVIGGE